MNFPRKIHAVTLDGFMKYYNFSKTFNLYILETSMKIVGIYKIPILDRNEKLFGHELLSEDKNVDEIKAMEKKVLTPYETTILNLINKLSNPNVDIFEIEKIIKSDVNLSIDLLKFINSPIFGLRKEITSIKQALAILGIENLYKWLFLLLFVKDRDATENSVFPTALIRAKIMEELGNYLLKKRKISDKEFPEKAYLVGILSLIDSMFQIPKEKISLAPEIKEAVSEEKNPLGELLKLTKLLEKGSLFSIKTQLEKKGIPIDKALAICFQAYKYAREVLKFLKS